MKCFLVVVLWISPLLAFLQANAANDHAADEAAIRELNVTVLRAYNMGDLATLDRIEDDDFVLAGDFGEVPKKQQLEDVRRRKENASDVHLMVENQHIRFYGDTALLTEIEKYENSENPAGFQTTSLWVRRGSEWKVAHLHYSSLAKKP